MAQFGLQRRLCREGHDQFAGIVPDTFIGSRVTRANRAYAAGSATASGRGVMAAGWELDRSAVAQCAPLRSLLRHVTEMHRTVASTHL